MAEQYWIGDFFVDLSRNQIARDQQTQTLAPKALAVLTHLAKNHGRVVSHNELLTTVWQNTVVSPNTLQKSIAQLRKALGDDGKDQIYIKTHAKQGYSLECEVKWQGLTESAKIDNTQADIPATVDINDIERNDEKVEDPASNKPTKLISIAAGIVILLLVGVIFIQPEPNASFRVDKLTLLTATDDKEFDATYSPDGRHIVFHRYLDKMCVNKLWAKDVNSHKEIQLTKDWGGYGIHSFSQDGKQLIFFASGPCNQPVRQKNCHDLVSVDFEKALESPQEPKVLLQCKNSAVKNPTWLNNDNIALMQKTANRWKLINYSISQGKSHDLFKLIEGDLIHYAYAPKADLIALTTIHEDGKHYIEMLKPDGTLISSHQIQYPKEIPRFRPLYPNFTPSNEQLIFSTGRQLFNLAFDGTISKINASFDETMQQPHFHPQGKRLLMIKGPYDSDVVTLPLNQTDTTTKAKLDYQNTAFRRTNFGEAEAVFQPGGKHIAFWSKRSGDEQIWLSDGEQTRQLSHFPMDTYIRGFYWSRDGKSLLVNANSRLIQINLDAEQQSFQLPYSVVRLFQWDSSNNTALIMVRIKGIFKWMEYHLNTGEMTQITDSTLLWAQKTDEGQLIYKDNLGQYWRSGPIEPIRIEALNNQSGKAKSFLLYNKVIYDINASNQLWSYDLNTDSFKILGELGNEVDYISDVNQSAILMTIQVSAKKEVVELVLSE